MLPEARQLQTTILTTYIIIAGLLTTSTYPAVYTPTIETTSDTGGALSNSPTLIWLFRMFNVTSFVCSLAAIIGSFVLILTLNNSVGGYRKMSLSPHALKWWNRLHVVVQVIFVLALMASAIAVLLGAVRFDRKGYSIACLCALSLGMVVALGFAMYRMCSVFRGTVSDTAVRLEERLVIAHVLLALLRSRKPENSKGWPLQFDEPVLVLDILTSCIQVFRERYPTDPLPFVFSSHWALIHCLEQSWGAKVTSGDDVIDLAGLEQLKFTARDLRVEITIAMKDATIAAEKAVVGDMRSLSQILWAAGFRCFAGIGRNIAVRLNICAGWCCCSSDTDSSDLSRLSPHTPHLAILEAGRSRTMLDVQPSHSPPGPIARYSDPSMISVRPRFSSGLEGDRSHVRSRSHSPPRERM